METKQREVDEYEAILATATREADVAMQAIEHDGVDAVEAAATANTRANAEPIGWRASWFRWMAEVRGARVVVTLIDGREVSLDRSHARTLGRLLCRLADELPRGDERQEEHDEMVLRLCG